jgi:hypothetical protein
MSTCSCFDWGEDPARGRRSAHSPQEVLRSRAAPWGLVDMAEAFEEQRQQPAWRDAGRLEEEQEYVFRLSGWLGSPRLGKLVSGLCRGPRSYRRTSRSAIHHWGQEACPPLDLQAPAWGSPHLKSSPAGSVGASWRVTGPAIRPGLAPPNGANRDQGPRQHVVPLGAGAASARRRRSEELYALKRPQLYSTTERTV